MDKKLKCIFPGERRTRKKCFRVSPSIEKKMKKELAEVGLSVADLIEFITLDEKLLKEFKEKYKKDLFCISRDRLSAPKYDKTSAPI